MSRFRSRPVRRRARRATPLLLACALALAAVACGDEGPSGGDCGAEEDGSGDGSRCGDAGAGGTTVDHMSGTTGLPEDPERVVTIGLRDHETAGRHRGHATSGMHHAS